MSERQPGLKRSEAIKAIRALLEGYTDDDADEEEKEDTADCILSKLEKLGIKPPARDADLRSSYGYARVWEWENE